MTGPSKWAKRETDRNRPRKDAIWFLETLERLERQSRWLGEQMTASSQGIGRGQAADPSLTDPESGLPNRLHFDVVHRVVFAAGVRGFPLTVVIVEPEGLPGDEEGWGEVGSRLLDVTRTMDLLARFDERRFVILMLGCNVHGGRVAAERVLHALAPWLDEKGARISIGIAAFVPEMQSPEDLVRMSEAALAAAKEAPDSAIETRP